MSETDIKIEQRDAKAKIDAQIEKGKKLTEQAFHVLKETRVNTDQRIRAKDNFVVLYDQWCAFTAEILSQVFVSNSYANKFREKKSSKSKLVGSNWKPDIDYYYDKLLLPKIDYLNILSENIDQFQKAQVSSREINKLPDEIPFVSEGRHFPRTKQPITPKKCFVLMPIQKGFDEVYHDVIKPTLKKMGLHVIRADEIYSSNPIMDDIWENIQTAGWIIADMSGKNPNVFYETGLAHAIGRDVIMLAQNIEDIPFDLRHWRVILYKQTISGAVELKERLKKTIVHDKQYAQIPVDLLTKEFKGGFIVDYTETTVKLSGVNGSCAAFSEKWNIVPTREDPYQSFHRKISTAGSIEEVEGVDCSVSYRQFLTGNFIFTITSPTTLSKGKDFPYQLNYKILNGFALGEEVWTFGIESETKHLHYCLVFCKECLPSSFKALLRTESGELIKELGVQETTESETKTYTIELHSLSIGINIVFRWQWGDQGR